ncbi:MAG: 3-oxoacyl-ACP synthase III [Planctomycetota bacterium]
MKFRRVRIASLAWHLPDAAVTSDELERRIEPLYARLGLSVGRLELMSGIRERRLWPVDVRPSTVAAEAGRRALEAAGVAPAEIGMVLHTSVCRDFLEPATASVVHAALGLPPEAQALDLSNACLGFVNGMVMAGALLEAGHLQAALVVSGENGGPLVEQTVAWLNQDEGIGRNELKRAFSSLTIGAGAVAAVLVRDEGETGHRLLGATARSATQHHALCSGGTQEGLAGPLMETDSEALLAAGIELARETFAAFGAEHGLAPAAIDRVITHQVGSAHRRLLLEALELGEGRDFPTFPVLGNVGTVSLPISLGMAAEQGFVGEGQRVALLGIGSGLACQMLDVRW